MSFNSRIATFNTATLGRFANATVTFSLNGVAVKSDVKAILDENVEVFSPGQAELSEPMLVITVDSSDMTGIDRTHIAHVVPMTGYLGSLKEGDFKIYGEPDPDGHGLTRIILVAKK